MINRSVLIVRPKQAFLDWAKALDDSELVPDPDGEMTCYLIPNFDTEEELWEIIEEIHPTIFENELWSWHTDEGAWPQTRDLASFQNWFGIEVHTVVEDLCDYELVDEDVD